MSKLFAVLFILLEHPTQLFYPTKLFSELYLAKFLDSSVKSSVNSFRVAVKVVLILAVRNRSIDNKFNRKQAKMII